jgi:hypothetical protein
MLENQAAIQTPSTGQVNTGNGLVQMASPKEVTEAEAQAAIERAKASNVLPLATGIAAHIKRCWEDARDAKSTITERLLDAQRARMGKYDAATEASITEFGGSSEYARITDNKCRVAEGWLRDVYLGQTERPWTIKPTPKPDIPPDAVAAVKRQLGEEMAQIFLNLGVMPNSKETEAATAQLQDAEKERLDEVARKTAERMEYLMADQMTEGGFLPAVAQFLVDLTTYPAAHIKAPVLRNQTRLQWAVGADGKWAPQTTTRVIPQFERVDPFRIFPAPGITNPQEGYMLEWIQYSRSDIYNLIGVPGFNEDAIRAVLDQYGKGGLKDWMGYSDSTQRDNVNDAMTNTGSSHVTIDCLEYNGPIRGQDLLDWGMDAKQIKDPQKDYETSAWLIGNWVIKAQINPDPLGRRPYYKTSYEEIPGSYWGLGVPDLLSDVQGVVNATVRALINNMGMASGPQVEINVDRIPAGEDLTALYPWKIWQTRNSEYGNNTSPAIQFFQPASNVNDLLAVLEKFYQLSDDFSLVPRVMSGNDRISGPGRTASGTSMLLSAANKGLKGVVGNIDMYVMTPILEALYNFNMLNSDDETVKGDCQVVARGAVSLMQLESLQLRRNEFLASTANPIDQQIVGPEGRAEILRETAKGLELDTNRVVPSREKLQQMTMQNAAAAQQPAGPNGEVLANGQAVTDNFSPTK